MHFGLEHHLLPENLTQYSNHLIFFFESDCQENNKTCCQTHQHGIYFMNRVGVIGTSARVGCEPKQKTRTRSDRFYRQISILCASSRRQRSGPVLGDCSSRYKSNRFTKSLKHLSNALPVWSRSRTSRGDGGDRAI